MLRGIRGAATVEKNSQEEIWRAAKELVTTIIAVNQISVENIGAIIFTSTKDLTAAFPSSAVRQIQNLQFLPLFDAQETEVEGSLPLCIRVLILADIEKSLQEVQHVYLGEAKNLRPDLCGE